MKEKIKRISPPQVFIRVIVYQSHSMHESVSLIVWESTTDAAEIIHLVYAAKNLCLFSVPAEWYYLVPRWTSAF